MNGVRFSDKTDKQRLATLICRYAYAPLLMSVGLVYPLEIRGHGASGSLKEVAPDFGLRDQMDAR